MKILMVSSYFLPHRGGVESHLLGLSRELGRRGHQVTILTPRYRDSLPQTEEIAGIKVVRFPVNPLPKVGQLLLYRWLRQHRHLIGSIDLIHGHDLYLKPLRWLYRSTPYYVTFHGYEGFPLKKRDIQIRRFVARSVRGSIAVGDFIGKWYGVTPTAVTYGAVSPPSLPMLKQDLDATFVGRLEPDTGATTYAQALKTLSTGKPIKVAFIGSGSLKDDIEKILSSGKIQADLPGTVGNVPEYLSRSKVALVSGYLSILEAMIRRVPVVALYENPLKKDYLEMIPGSAQIMATAAGADGVASKIREAWAGSAKVNTQVELAYRWANGQTWSKLADTYEKLWGLR